MSIVRFKRAQEASRAYPAYLEPPHPFVTQNRNDLITGNAIMHTQRSTGKGPGYKLRSKLYVRPIYKTYIFI